jgi:hypothetical protein
VNKLNFQGFIRNSLYFKGAHELPLVGSKLKTVDFTGVNDTGLSKINVENGAY